MSGSDSHEPPSEPLGPRSSPCRNLRHPGMHVYTDGRGRDPKKDYDNTIYWCLKTMTSFGPDDEMVDGEACRAPARSCYQPF